MKYLSREPYFLRDFSGMVSGRDGTNIHESTVNFFVCLFEVSKVAKVRLFCPTFLSIICYKTDFTKLETLLVLFHFHFDLKKKKKKVK